MRSRGGEFDAAIKRAAGDGVAPGIGRNGERIAITLSHGRQAMPTTCAPRAISASSGLFDVAPRPLADRLRPKRLDDVVGQDHLLGPEGPDRPHAGAGPARLPDPLGPARHAARPPSRACWRSAPNLDFEQLSAIFSGVKDLRAAFEKAEGPRATGKGTLLFVDEIHRFNRAQQDGFLPFVERGVVTLVGATTENPTFELNGALLSRTQVMVLKRLDDAGARQAAASRRGADRQACAADRRCPRRRCARWPMAMAAISSTCWRKSSPAAASRHSTPRP